MGQIFGDNLIPPELVTEITYVALTFCLFVFPRFLIRFGVPYALTTFTLGFVFNFSGVIVYEDNVVSLLATLGIVSLFLFAGLEVDTTHLKKDKRILIQHLLALSLVLVGSSFLLQETLDLSVRTATLFALALLTPSAGFILDAIDTSRLSFDTKYWIRSKAIAAELLALILMFSFIKSSSFSELGVSLLALVLLFTILPVLFVFFIKRVAPLAPKSEFGFLLIMALLAGIVTKTLGVYYLIGAFIVGTIARRFELIQPEFSSYSMMNSLKFFTNFFTPFYFFHAGARISPADFSPQAFLIGGLLLLVFIPLRVYLILFHRHFSLREEWKLSFPVATSLLPNLVFGLVIADILLTRFELPHALYGALIIYTIGATLLPPVLQHYFWKGEASEALVEIENSMGAITFYDKREPEKDHRL